MLGDDLVEELIVPGLLFIHVLHQRSQVWVRACEDGGLRSIDENCSEFASLIHAQGGGEEVSLLLGEFVDGLSGIGVGR